MTVAQVAHRPSGHSLIELMVAMALGLIVAIGFVAAFVATSSSYRTQAQLNLLQESGRFAIDRLSRDLRAANAFYCGRAGAAPTVLASDLLGALHDVTTRWGRAPYPAAPVSPYRFPRFLSMRGYACGKTSCVPAAPATLPAMGRAAGQRVIGADVLTLRYLDPAGGWAVRGAAAIAGSENGAIHHLAIQPAENEPAIADTYQPGDLLMLADCALTQIFSANLQSGGMFYPDAMDAGSNLAQPRMPQSFNAPRLFDVNRDFRTVTYYLQVVNAGDGITTGALMRRENGHASEVVRGVERLDFRYGVQDASGATHHLAAAQVDDGAGGGIACPPMSSDAYGCLWGAVRSIEVHLLLDGQQVQGALGGGAMHYAYSIDGDVVPAAPEAPTRKLRPAEQGFDRRMLRREFGAFVAVRSYPREDDETEGATHVLTP
ncbi:PilW family protein [Dyella sp. LX-66]|uniref:PilW family protein n=1 Tax=unclassified Dyella TaxID=2634549 RepID=UPI001BE0F413|nr:MULTISPECIES: PilW family protein [unclassified Dyella]MBT2118138.1 PilW family protein [Dyella sp. LX-1]MBT2138836.1 PilW family protein [Dyella sp. LX-66]